MDRWIGVRATSRIFHVAAVLVALAGMAACDPVVVTRERVVGEYFDQVRNDGSLSLDLRDDGTYVQRFRQSTSKIIETTGKWEFSFSRQAIQVHDLDVRLPGEKEERKTWEFVVAEDWGMIRLWRANPRTLMYLGAKR